MGKLCIKGVDINTYISPIPSSEVGTKHSAIPNKLKGISANYDSGNYKIITGWSLPNDNGWSSNSNYDAAKGKLKVNGTIAPIYYHGTRPRNISCQYGTTGTGLTYYLNNVNGTLYVSTSPNTTGTYISESYAPNKDVIVNIVLFGAGGKGGGGAYWFLAGNWGGVGGAGGGKVLLTICVKNNDYFRITTDTDGDYKGRTTDSSDTTYESPGIRMYRSSGSEQVHCWGGYSGTANHPRWHSDGYGGGGNYSVQSYALLPTIRRKQATGAGKIGNGQTGNNCTFGSYASPYWGNPENNRGNITETATGGRGPDGTSYSQGHGSGGGAGYGNGGLAGDTGSGSNGSAGSDGGGGGGSGSPAGGASGGSGGLPGFYIYI